MTRRRYAVVGGGILGAAVAAKLQDTDDTDDTAQVTLLGKEDRRAQQQTGRNSGVVHAGLSYTPGSLKARLCRRGVGMLRELCVDRRAAVTARRSTPTPAAISSLAIARHLVGELTGQPVTGETA